MTYIYLHGFASGPQSGKAQFFRRCLAAHGIDLRIPALDGGDFEHLTVTGQLAILDREAAAEPVCLIGSSMGGYLAALYASSHPNVRRLVLLAPAFSFLERWPEVLGAGRMEQWRATGRLDVFHYGYGENRPLHYGLIEDAARYPGMPDFDQPAWIFHGTRDEVVPAELSRRFAATHPNVQLRLLDSDHQLTDVTEQIWQEVKPFLLG